jgi:hypothetical protein
MSRDTRKTTHVGYRILVLMYNTLFHKQLQEKYASLHAVVQLDELHGAMQDHHN